GLALHRKPMSLGAVVRRVVDNSREAQPTRPIALVMDHDVIVNGDGARLANVVSTLLDNADKYSPLESTISVRLARRAAHAILTVSDRGIGIPKEQQSRLFERFFRAGNAPVSNYGGLGLGLYIARDIIERHGGRISVESDSGAGAIFVVELPARPV